MTIWSITWYTNKLDTYNQSSLLVVSVDYMDFGVVKSDYQWINNFHGYGSLSAPENTACNMHLVHIPHNRPDVCGYRLSFDISIWHTGGRRGTAGKEADGKSVGFISLAFFTLICAFAFAFACACQLSRRLYPCPAEGYELRMSGIPRLELGTKPSWHLNTGNTSQQITLALFTLP